MVTLWFQRLWPWLAAALSGLALALCFPNWNQTWLAWLALVPLIWAVWFSGQHAGRNWLYHAGLGYCAGLAFFWLTFRWLVTVTGIGWFVLPLYLALYFAFWAWFIGAIACHRQNSPENSQDANSPWMNSGRNLWIALLGASAWVAQEALRGILFTGFGWNGLGVALHRQVVLLQITNLTGVAGLSFLVAFCNLMIVLTLKRLAIELGKARMRPHFDVSLTIALVAMVFAYGIRQLQYRPESVPLRLASVQANIPQYQKFDREFEDRIFEAYTRLTRDAAAFDPDLLLWPEAATPLPVFMDRRNYDFVRDAATMGNYSFLFGSLDFENESGFNVAILFSGLKSKPQVYRKIHLVPFGEFIPFRHSFPLFAWIAGDLVPGDFVAGKEFTLLKMQDPDLQIAPLICFEDTLGDLTRHFVQGGADLLVNITNDGWFLDSEAAEQHLANSVFRAAENQRPLVRSANTGVTAYVDHFGGVRMSLRGPEGGHFIEGCLLGVLEVPVNAPMTFYTRHGEVFAIACSAVTVLSIGVASLRRRQGK